MKLGLFVPCYIDQFYPHVARCTLELLEKLQCNVDYPSGQTCCGQPLANMGWEDKTIPAHHHYMNIFHSYDYVVTPSASCAHFIRHMDSQVDNGNSTRTLDLIEFLVDVLQLKNLEASFPAKVCLHQSCHGLRGMRMASSSERVEPAFSKWKYILGLVDDIDLVEPSRTSECCGFGGTFSITEESLSAKMGQDKLADILDTGTKYVTSGDMSCLMHLEGLIKRNNYDLRVLHISEILNSSI